MCEDKVGWGVGRKERINLRGGCGGRKVRWKGKHGWGRVDAVTSRVVTPGVGVDVAASSVVVDVAVCSLAEGG